MLHCIRNGLWIAPIFVLAGCWQKIEYTGKPVAASKTPVSPTAVTDNATVAKPTDVSMPTTVEASQSIGDVANVPPAPEFQLAPATPTVPPADKLKPVDD